MNAQLTGFSTDPHVEMGHHGAMAALALILTLAAILGASSLPGSRAVALLGIASIVFADYASSLATVGGMAAIV
ncbi:MAG: hypothetical protein V3S32_05235 [Acidimicrobiia bacterium]